MPEGDTIFRTAASLRRWLVGRAVTDARSRVPGLPAARLVGQRVATVESRGKHLLVRFESGEVLHSHMRMTGSWHVYPAGEPWRRPERQARLVLTAGERVAVCFNAPVVELLPARAELAHPALGGLGPDVLDTALDLAEVRRRARARPPATAVGEVLGDQRVVAGIGNVYRSEALFARGLSPWTPIEALDDDALDALVHCAAELVRANVGAIDRDFGAGPRRPFVYRRTGRPCRRCATPIRSRRLGEQARTVYWCPRCQPSPAGV
jgi:endonuclease VIII